MSSSYIYTNGIRVHYIQSGTRDADYTLILLHGLASNARIWELILPFLGASGYALIAPDARCHGLTDVTSGDLNFEVYFRDLISLIDTLSVNRPVLVGHSWGGHRVIDYAARISVGAQSPAGIILVDGGMSQLNYSLPGYPTPTWESIRDRLAPPHLAGTPLLDFTDMVTSYIKNLVDDDEQLEQIISIILANFLIYLDDETGIECIAPHLSFDNHMKIVRSMWEFNTYDYYSRIRCPVLMIPARKNSNQISPDDQFLKSKEFGIQQAKQKIQHLEVAWMDQTIHDIPLQRPKELSDKIAEFISKL